MSRKQRRYWEQAIFKGLMRLSLLTVLAILGLILYTIIQRGLKAMSWEMISQAPEGGFYLGGGGGVLNAILGSLYLGIGATALALLLGVPIVFYLHSYAQGSRIGEWLRLILDVLWGIPSIVYGIFGFTIMLTFGIRASLLGGILTLALLEIPILVRGMDEVVRMIPKELRESTYALGLTKFESMMVLLRQAFPGLITAVLLAFGRGIGDAASVLFTAGYTDYLPGSLSQPVASLPLAIFFQLSSPFPSVQARAYASALILIVVVLSISLLARLSSRLLNRYVVR